MVVIHIGHLDVHHQVVVGLFNLFHSLDTVLAIFLRYCVLKKCRINIGYSNLATAGRF